MTPVFLGILATLQVNDSTVLVDPSLLRFCQETKPPCVVCGKPVTITDGSPSDLLHKHGAIHWTCEEEQEESHRHSMACLTRDPDGDFLHCGYGPDTDPLAIPGYKEESSATTKKEMVVTIVKDLLAAYQLEDSLRQEKGVEDVQFTCLKSYTCVDGYRREFDAYAHVLIVHLEDKKLGTEEDLIKSATMTTPTTDRRVPRFESEPTQSATEQCDDGKPHCTYCDLPVIVPAGTAPETSVIHWICKDKEAREKAAALAQKVSPWEARLCSDRTCLKGRYYPLKTCLEHQEAP